MISWYLPQKELCHFKWKQLKLNSIKVRIYFLDSTARQRRKRQRQMKRESEKGDGWDYESEARGGNKIGMVKLHMNLEDHACLKSHLKALMSRLFQRLQTKKKEEKRFLLRS